jgi:hypothetical protein
LKNKKKAFVGTFSYPFAAFNQRLVVKSMIFRNKNFTKLKFYITTVVWFLITLVIALFVPDISIVFGFTGSIGCTYFFF